jgi:hypothetical protein
MYTRKLRSRKLKSRKLKSRKLKTGIKGRGAYLRGWSKAQPSRKQRTAMLKKCGKKCFLGSKKSFPICSKNTCKINMQGLHAAYVRAREYESITGTKSKNSRKYKDVARKAYNMLYK